MNYILYTATVLPITFDVKVQVFLHDLWFSLFKIRIMCAVNISITFTSHSYNEEFKPYLFVHHFY